MDADPFERAKRLKAELAQLENDAIGSLRAERDAATQRAKHSENLHAAAEAKLKELEARCLRLERELEASKNRFEALQCIAEQDKKEKDKLRLEMQGDLQRMQSDLQRLLDRCTAQGNEKAAGEPEVPQVAIVGPSSGPGVPLDHERPEADTEGLPPAKRPRTDLQVSRGPSGANPTASSPSNPAGASRPHSGNPISVAAAPSSPSVANPPIAALEVVTRTATPRKSAPVPLQPPKVVLRINRTEKPKPTASPLHRPANEIQDIVPGYKNDLLQAGVVENLNSALPEETVADKQAALKSREESFRKFTPFERETVSRTLPPIDSTEYAITRNFLVEAYAPSGESRPSKIIATSLDSPKHRHDIDVGKPIFDFAVQDDLLVVLTSRPPSRVFSNLLLPSRREANYQMLFFTIPSGQPHTLANTVVPPMELPVTGLGVVDLEPASGDYSSMFEFSSALLGSVLAIVFKFRTSPHCGLRFYDWKAGKYLNWKTDDVKIGGLGIGFLDADHVLVLGKDRRCLEVIRIPGIDESAVTKVAFELPEFAADCEINASSIQIAGQSSTSTAQSGASRFLPREDDGLVVIMLRFCSAGEEQTINTLVIRRAGLLRLAKQPANVTRIVTWNVWGPTYARWLDPDSASASSMWSVVGQRLVMLKKDEMHKGSASICIADFNPRAVERQRNRMGELLKRQRNRGRGSGRDDEEEECEHVDAACIRVVGGESAEMCGSSRRPRVPNDEEMQEAQYSSTSKLPFAEPISKLSYVATDSKEKFKFDVVLMHADSVIGIQWTNEKKPGLMEIFRFG